MIRPPKLRSLQSSVLMLAAMVVSAGVYATYVTPGGGVAPSALADWYIQELLERKPAAPFPARIAVVRVQTPGSYSHSNKSFGRGRYSVVTTQDVERDEHFERIGKLEMVAGVATLNRLVIPANLNSDKQLRQAAAAVKTDLLV